MTYMKKNLHFCNLKKTHYGPTDGPTDGLTNRRTDRPSYRDARTHLKTSSLQVTTLLLMAVDVKHPVVEIVLLPLEVAYVESK